MVTKQLTIVSKDVIDSKKVMDNIDDNPSASITELTRIMVENIQRQQLNEMNVDLGMDICSQLKAASNNIFWKWNMSNAGKTKKLK